MSSPYVIVSAVHKPESSVEQWWKDNQQKLDEFEKEEYSGEVNWDMCSGEFNCSEIGRSLSVVSPYHSGRGESVIEVEISGKEEDMQDVRVSGLEEIVEEINYHLGGNFTLEVYYWYNSVDKPGRKC